MTDANRLPKIGFIVAFVVALGLAAPLVTGADSQRTATSAIRQVISQQFDAFAARDAQRAFSFASPRIKIGFEDADAFMAMVRDRYPAVYEASAVRFREQTPHDEFNIQRVQFIGPEGHYWDAFYRMEQQVGGQWRIGGVVVKPVEGGI